MSSKSSILNRDNSLILRGVAILIIVLHNFLHLEVFGFTGENEMEFSYEKAVGFFDTLFSGSNVIFEFLSHLGWIGVPVFVFLTGYGVAITSTSPLQGRNTSIYIKQKYLKLLALMLPAILFYVGIDILKGDIWPGLPKRFSYLTMLTNFAYPYLSCGPGIYWYFGLTFQFYLLWAFWGRKMNGKNLLVWSIILLCALFGFSAYGSSDALSIFRHCFTGWFPVFAIGVWLGIRKKPEDLKPVSVWLELLLVFVLLGLIILMSRWMVTWIFIPIIALAWFIVIGVLLMRTRYLSKLFRWIGKYSACIFVCHPIARLVVLNTLLTRFTNVTINLSVYIALTIVIAFLYNKVYQWLLSKMLPKAM